MLACFMIVACSAQDDMMEEQIDNNRYEYVDLGLKALWAEYNVGASVPTDLGEKYAFGESTTKEKFTMSNYVGNDVDVAKMLWGGDWRLPTDKDLSELITECKWSINTINGKEVMTATGPNGNSINFPYNSYIMGEGLAGWYWSSTSYSSTKAYCFHFEGNEISYGTIDKYNGFLVRAVITNPNYKEKYNEKDDSNPEKPSPTYEKPDIDFWDFTATTKSLKVEYLINNKDEAKVSSAKIYYGTSSNPTKSVNATVVGKMIIGRISGLKAGTTYYVKCSATGKGGTTTTSTTKCMTYY